MKQIVCGCLLALTALTAWGGTILTTNLPTDTAIVNISAREDGSASYNAAGSPTPGDLYQTYWYQPFNTTSTLLTYNVTPGTYTFRIISSADAAAMFPSLTGGQLSDIYTAWTYNTPWVTDYLVFNSTAASNSGEYQLFTGSVVPIANYPGFASAANAYDYAVNNGYNDEIVSGAGGRYNGTTSTSYTFAVAQTLLFVIPDNILADNTGGVSVLIQKQPSSDPTPTPEPSSALLLVAGLAAFGLRRRRHAGR